jgi:hypothetical protein
MKLLILTFCAAVSSLSYADTSKECFRDKLPYFQNFSQLSSSPKETLQFMATGCRELAFPKMTKAQSVTDVTESYVSSKIIFGLFGQAAASFSKLRGSSLQKQFMAQLEAIKSIHNPMDRIQKVYELVGKNQGHYDYDTMGDRTMSSGFGFFAETPNNVLNNAETRGTGGVCRDFASLLQWSLLQVARDSDSRSGPLGPHDFSSDFIANDITTLDGRRGGHAWVRVHLPQYNNRGKLIGFNNFDLDTTWYPKIFSPLFPRLSGLSEQTRIKATLQCNEIVECLSQQAFQSY